VEISVQVKNVYGNQLVYPICDKAKYFAKLARTSTLTPQAIDLIKRIGFTIVVVTNNPNQL
jgi:hypothetical protein